MKIYGVKFDCNTPSPKKISVPLNSQFQVNFQVAKNGEMIDFTAPGATQLSVSYNGTALSCDRFLNKGPVYQIDTGNVATRQSIKAALPGSEFNLFVELTDGDVYEIDEVGGGGFDPSELSDYYTKSETSSAVELSDAFASFEPSVPRDLSVDSITFPHNVINEEEVEADRYAIMLSSEMVIDGNIEANDARLDNLKVFSNLSAGQLSVTSGAVSQTDVTEITNEFVKVGMRSGVPTGFIEANQLNLGADEYGGTFEMIGEQFNIKPTERDGDIGSIRFIIDPEDKSTDGLVALWGSPQVQIGAGGYLDLTQDVPITVLDPTEGVEVNLIPTAVTIDGVDYVIMAATAPQP